MQKKLCKGFTLLEVMIVVLIAVIVTVFSVPAYKKTQEKNRYRAASGVLMDLDNAMRMFKEDYPDYEFNFSGDVGLITANGTNTTDTPPTTSANNLAAWLQSHSYLNQIPFTNGTYMGYQFRFDGACCSGAHGANVCMTSANELSEYSCVWIDKQGALDYHYKDASNEGSW